MDKKLQFWKPKEWWSLRKQERAELRKLKDMEPDNDLYGPTLNAIEQTSKIRNEKSASRMNVLKVVGGLVVSGLALFAAFNIDKDDTIVRNKTSQKVFDKLFRF